VRYVGSIDVAAKAVKVGLQYFDKDSAIAGLKLRKTGHELSNAVRR
jgi:hypothetical protein